MRTLSWQRRAVHGALYLILGLFLSSASLGFESVEVLGRGATEAEAIRSALAESVRQVNESSAGSSNGTQEEVAAILQGLHDVPLGLEDGNFGSLRAASRGYVRSYEVLRSSGPEAPVEVRVRATVLRFDPENPRTASGKTLLVGVFELGDDALGFDRPVEGVPSLLDSLREELENRLVRARKFLVLTREDLGPSLNKLQFKSGRWIGGDERQGPGDQYGIDYLVSGQIDTLKVHTEKKVVRRTGHVYSTKTAEVQMTMTLHDVTSGQIIWSEAFAQNYLFGPESLRDSPEFLDDGTVARTMAFEAADTLTQQLLAHSCPPTVLKAKVNVPGGPILVLNVGSSIYPGGHVLELVHVGTDLIDPATGRSLGPDESLIGLIQIVRQDEHKSEATFVNLSPEIQSWIAANGLDPAVLACRQPEVGR